MRKTTEKDVTIARANMPNLRLNPRFATRLTDIIQELRNMANNVNPHQQPQGMDSHASAYEGFLKGSVGLSIICGFVLVALVAARFMDWLNVFTCFAGLIVGSIAVLIDVKANKSWYLSGGLLVLYGLFVAINL